MACTYPRLKPQQLDQYYIMWMEGKSDAHIAKALNVKLPRIRANYLQIHTYCQGLVVKETRHGLKNKKIPPYIDLTPERQQAFLEYVENGCSDTQAADLLGIPPITVTMAWYKNEEFKLAVKMARERSDYTVMAAMRKTATGYTREVQESSKTMDEKGKLTSSTTYNRSYHIKPSDKAQMNWLANRRPEEWGPDNHSSNDKDKGEILKFINELAKD